MADILVLEDDDLLARQIRTALQAEGHRVTVFRSAVPALKHFEEFHVDLVVADLFIKQGDAYIQEGGIKLTSVIRQIHQRDTPVIAISGSFSSENGEYAASSAITVGANATLAKPFHPDELTALVKTFLKT
ncbi:MAG: response regulator [Pseudomonadota bacterium]